MKKNLKKVISAVIALALSVTSVAMAAPKFSDVAETASYAQAVEVLGALGVISGYEDGTFKPDNNITRAEVATMVVAALNRSADADGAKGTTKFDDMNVDAKTWATGFVNIGVQEGFISGYEDGSFKPDNNVTFAEMVSMLVRVAGYGRYAEYLGGWKTGYLSVGNDYGITKGVACAEDVAVTRGQVAQMIYNTLVDVPMVKSTTLTTDSNGNLVPEMTIMNGKGDADYETLLTEKHNAYYVEGKVTATNKSTSGSLDADQVNFLVEYTENFDDSEVVIKKGQTVTVNETVGGVTQAVTKAKTHNIQKAYIGDTAAADYFMTYSSAIVKIDDYDDVHFVWFAPSGKNDIIEFDATLIDDDDYTASKTVYSDAGVLNAKPYVRFFETKDAAKSQKYELETGFQLYVNGVFTTANKTNFEKYVVNNTVGTITLIDAYKTDGEYDYIFVTWYGTAKVDSVNAANGRIGFKSAMETNNRMNLVLDPEDDDITYSIEYNGEEIEVSALQKDDVLSIAYDVNATGTGVPFQNSTFYEIHVSRDKVEGKYAGKKDLDEVVSVGGKDYEYVGTYSSLVNDPSFKMSDEYTLYLDVFGRIYDFETLASAEKYAILDKYVKLSSDDYYRATLYTTDGVGKPLEVDTTKVVGPNGEKATDPAVTVGTTSVPAIDYAWSQVVEQGGVKTAVNTRVVKYKVSTSSGRITYMELLPWEETSISTVVSGGTTTTKMDEFDAYRNSIGSIVMSDATNIVDAIEYTDMLGKGKKVSYSDLKLGSLSSFVDRSEYGAYAFGTANSDGSYPFVLVVDGKGYYTTETQLAVVTEYAGLGVDENNEEVYKFTALYNGEEIEFAATDDADVYGFATGTTIDTANLLVKGDVIAFVQGADEKVTEISRVVSAAALGLDSGYDTVWKKAMTNAVEGAVYLPDSGVFSTDYATYGKDDEWAVLTYGPIIEKTSNSFRIGTVTPYTTLTQGRVDDNGDPVNDENGVQIIDNLYIDGTGAAATAAFYGVDKTDKTQYEDIKVTDETIVYTWDYNYSKNAQLCDSNAGAGAIVATQIGDAALYNNKSIIPFGTTANVKNENATTNFAFAKVVDGYATEVFVILAK